MQSNPMVATERFRAALTLIRTVSKKLLLNRDFLVSVIRAAGIHNFGPYDEYPEVEGMILQDPHQLAGALQLLSGHKFNTFVEFGTWSGHTACFMTAFLLRFNPHLKTTCVDPRNVARETHNLPVTFVVGTSDDVRAQRFDLAFIDGDHTYAWVERDYHNVGIHAPVCMFHDIDNAEFDILDPGQFWKNLKEVESGNAFFEFKYPGKHFMGIGVRIRHKEGV